MDYMTCASLVQNLSLVDGFTCVFIVPMGYWWVYLIFMVALGGSYVATRRPEILAGFSLLGSAVAAAWLPVYVQYGIYIIAVFSLAASIYIWVRGKDNQNG